MTIETSPDTDHDGGERIEVNLDESDAGKAVVRTRATPKARAGRESDKVDLESWAERSKKVQRRINSMQRNFDQQRAEDQAAHQRELAALNDRLNGLARGGGDAPAGDEAAHEKVMAAMQAELEEAQERGDSKEVAKITAAMSRTEGKYWAAQTAKQTGAKQTDSRAGSGTEQRAAEQRTGATANQAPNPTKAGIAWARANSDWWDDKDDENCVAARGLANTLYNKMRTDGEDAESPAFYERIRKQVAKRFPELEVISTAQRDGEDLDDDLDEQAPDRRQREPVRRQAMPVTDRGQGTGRNRAGGQTLTKADISTMRQVGLDPDKNAHVISFLKEKNQLEADA